MYAIHVVTREAHETMGFLPPPLNFISDPFVGVWSSHALNGKQGEFLETTLNLINGLPIPAVPGQASDGSRDVFSTDVFLFVEPTLVHDQGLHKTTIIPVPPKTYPIQEVGVFNVIMKCSPSGLDVVTARVANPKGVHVLDTKVAAKHSDP